MNAFLVFEALDKLQDLEKMDAKTNKGQQIKTDFLKEGALPGFGTKHNEQQIADDIKNIKQYLSDPVFKNVMNEYDLQKKSKKKIYWYTLFDGATSVEALSRQLNRYTFYEIMYRKWSKSVHGHEIFKNKIHANENDEVFINGIREPIGLALISKFACLFAINTFGHYVKAGYPEKLKEYQEWETTFIDNFTIDLGHEYISYAKR